MSEQLTDGERITRLETRLETIEGMLLRMETKLDMWQSNYYPKEQINEMFRSRDEQIRELKEDKRNNKQAWPMWVAASAAVVSVLVAMWPHIK